MPRLDEFEKRIKLQYDGFYILGFIDTNAKDHTKIIDYKTGGIKKEFQYLENNYDQLCVYSLALRQQYGVTPTEAEVVFIRRGGNAYRGERLIVADEEPITIPVDVSLERLKTVYWDILRTAKDISKYYEQNVSTTVHN